MKTKVGIIGPGRRRNGIGEYTAKFFHRSGAHVAAVVSSSLDRAIINALQLQTKYGINCNAYATIVDMFNDQALDAVAICSPAEVHLEQLQLALDHSVHVFCEKPLVWAERADVDNIVATLGERFQEAGLVLHYNTQWIYTLPFFEDIYGNINVESIHSITIELSSSHHCALNMLIESGPHANSLLFKLGAREPAKKRGQVCCWLLMSALCGIVPLSDLPKQIKIAHRS